MMKQKPQTFQNLTKNHQNTHSSGSNLSPNQNICRICFQIIDSQSTFQACKCKGSHLFVHMDCQLNWVKQSGAVQTFLGQQFFECEICHGSISLQYQTTHRFLTIKEIKNHLRCSSECKSFSTAIVIQFIFFLAFMVYHVVVQRATGNKMVLYLALGCLSCSLFFICLFVYTILVKEEKKLVGFKQNENWRVRIAKKMHQFCNTHFQTDE